MTGPIPEFGGCLWPMDEACRTDEWNAYDLVVQHRALALASASLHRLTAGRVGGCPVTVRPCKRSCGGVPIPAMFTQYGAFNPHINSAGYWVNFCGCQTDCGCTELCEIALPGPIGRIEEIKVDGAVIPPSNYRIDGNSVVWVGAGACPWPTCQDLAKPDTEVGTFSITYLNAYPVDSIGAYAVGILALEFAKACSGSKCRLPSGVTSVTRGGVSYDINPGVFPDGFTGIREVDAFIGLWNPGGLRQRSGVWFPGINTPRVSR